MPPPSPEVTTIAADDLHACRTALRGGSRTFHAASLLLPRAVREPATALYAFCRLADDTIDVDGGDGAALARLDEWLDRIYAGRATATPVDRAFAAMVARHAIPRALPAALLEGLAWDVAGRRYDDLPALRAYAARVAGTVGAMMAMLMGARSRDALARACDLGVAMQLSNIARDVGEDARAGRLYLPQSWLREHGIEPNALLAAPAQCEALPLVVQRLVDAAEALYERAADGIALLPPGCRPGINAARVLYGEIGRRTARRGRAALVCRTVVPATRKVALLACAIPAACLLRQRPPLPPLPPLPETAFLVEAAAASAAASTICGTLQASPRWWQFGERLTATIELFMRLEQRGDARVGQGD